MDYKDKYEKALKRCIKLYNEAKANEYTSDMEDYETIFPELKESGDEKIRKGLIKGLSAMRDIHHHQTFSDDAININEALAWLERQGKSSEQIHYWTEEEIEPIISDYLRGAEHYGGMIGRLRCLKPKSLEKQGEHQQLYIRFGDIPANEKSKIYREEKEIGSENGVSVYPAFKLTNGDIVLGLNLPITKTTLHTQQHLLEYDNRPCYLVTGDYVGKDTDGQILISKVNIIEKIDNYRVKTEKQGDTTSDTRYEVKAGDSLSVVNGKPFDYEKATITQKVFAPKQEPKFKVDDWVVISTTKGDRVVQIASVEYFNKNGYPSYITTEGRWFGNGTKARLLTDKDVEITTIPESKAIVNKIKSWSDEDELNLKGIIDEIQANKSSAPSYDIKTYDRFLDWLKSLKDRIKGKKE